MSDFMKSSEFEGEGECSAFSRRGAAWLVCHVMGFKTVTDAAPSALQLCPLLAKSQTAIV